MLSSQTITSRLARSAAQRVFRQTTPTSTLVATTRFNNRAFHASSRKMVVHNIETLAAWNEALEKNKVVMLDCFATWCGPCKAIAPILVKHSNEEEFKDVFFAKIDVDQLPDLSQELGIRAMPTFMVFVDGKKADELVGANPGGLKTMLVKAASGGAPAPAPVDPSESA